MGTICHQCANNEKDEDSNVNEKNVISPKNFIAENINNILDKSDKKLTLAEEKRNTIDSIGKKEDSNIPHSKSTKHLKKKKSDDNLEERANKMIFEHNKLIFEEESKDIIENKLSKSINPLVTTNNKGDQQKNNLHLEELKIGKKLNSDVPFKRRKKKSSTVKQNEFLFAKIFSTEVCMPISQENLIWEKKGFPKYHYYRGQLLGKGAFGEVYQSKNIIFNRKVAMKIIKKDKILIDNLNNDLYQNENDYIKSEINILAKLSHPNIVRIYEFYDSENYFYLINEFCKGGQLYDYIQNSNLNEAQLCVIFYQVFSGLIYLHENNIIHGDLKPENILISSKEKNLETNEEYAWIKIIDFGTAKIFKKSIIKGDTIVGSLHYISPEVFSNQSTYNEKSDIWSIGVILYKSLTKKYPFDGKIDNEIINNITEKEYNKDDELLSGFSDEIHDLIYNLLKKDPKERPSAKEALNHKWFKKFNGRRLFSYFKKEEMEPYINNLFKFSFSKIHQLVIAFLVHNLPETDSSQKILKLFRYFNESGDCKLSKEELKKGLKEFKTENNFEEKFDDIFRELDGDNNGTIEFEEFLRACINKNEILNDKYLNYAFKFLDKGNRKLLSPEQIISAFSLKESKTLQDSLNKIMEDNNYDKDGMINFEEFKNIIIHCLD